MSARTTTSGLLSPTVPQPRRPEALRSGGVGAVHSWDLTTAQDGPGTRLAVFLAGCPLRCLYCHNPDTTDPSSGTPTPVDELVAKVERYRQVFDATGGGLTVSGGEPLFQPAFVARLLRGAKELGVHTAIDTSGHLGRHMSDQMLADTDLVLLDVKSGDPEVYRHVAGRSLRPTLDFGRRIASTSATRLWVRFVLVPGLTDDPRNVDLVADYAASLEELRPGTVERVDVLPFHQMGRAKWAGLGKTYTLSSVEPPSPEAVQQVRDRFAARGLVAP